MSQAIFIRYRRDDTSGFAGRLFDRLAESISRDHLFIDVESIEPGANFAQVLSEQVGQCDVLLVLIGARWLNPTPDGSLRLSDPKDLVRIEIETALARDVRVIPLLIDGAQMPAAQDLPEPVRALAQRQAVEISHKRFETDVERLLQALRRIIKPSVQIANPGASAETPTLPDKPSIAVLSFQNMSGDPEQEYFSDGIAEDIITMLSHSPSLFVIARNSSFSYKGRAVDVKQIARELGVRYVLEGSVRRGGNRVRITAQLIDAGTGNHLWAERYDRDPADIFAVQDEITEAVATATEPAVARMERRRAVRKPPESLSAWEAYQRGLWHIGRVGAAENEAAKRFFRQAVELDPNFATAHAELAMAIVFDAISYQATSITDASEKAFTEAKRALFLDPLDAVAHNSMGCALFTRGDVEGALAEARKALDISPNYNGAHHLLGSALLWCGRPREGVEAVRKAMRLDPQNPRPQRGANIAVGLYNLREYEAAIKAAKEALRSYPDHAVIYRWLAAALGQLGRLDEAKQALQEAIALAPKSFDMYVRQRAPWVPPEDHGHMLEGLRKAGWEG